VAGRCASCRGRSGGRRQSTVPLGHYTIIGPPKGFFKIELIGDGIHERVVVNVERFDQRVQRKVGPR